MNQILFFIMTLFYTATDASVKVSVYYETLCPDSISFIKDQLYSNYEAFGEELIQLELIPYGHAKETNNNGSTTFICQHGPKECYGNLIHGIVIDIQPISVSARFVYCSERSTTPTSEEILKQCAEENSISWTEIEKELKNGKGNKILSENGKKTRELNPKFIPSVVFNNLFNQDDQNRAIYDFKGVVCKYLMNKPSQCHSRNIEVVQILN